jgi:hypothetical protein
MFYHFVTMRAAGQSQMKFFLVELVSGDASEKFSRPFRCFAV